MVAMPSCIMSLRSSTRPSGRAPPTSSHRLPRAPRVSSRDARAGGRAPPAPAPGPAEAPGFPLGVRAARGGELEAPPAGVLVAAHEPLVLELRERGVDRAGARAPGPAAALLELLHELVAVAR